MTINFQLSPRAKKDGTVNVRLRIYDHAIQKSSYFATPVNIQPKAWNDKRQLVRGDTTRVKQMNEVLNALKFKAETIYFENSDISLDEFKRKYQGDEPLKDYTLENALDSWIKTFRNKRSAKSRKSMIDQFIKYAPNTNLGKIDYEWLNGAVNYFRGVGNTEYTIGGKLTKLRAFLNHCIRSGYLDKNPFDNFTIKKGRPKPRFSLSHEELIALASVELSGKIELARDTFLVQLFCDGLRVSDALRLKKEHIKGDSIVYQAGENNKHKQTTAVYIIDALQRIIDKYADDTRETILPWFDEIDYDTNTDGKIALINKNLKKAGKRAGIKEYHRLTSHVARHTHAINLLNAGASIKDIQLRFKHSDIKTTDAYLKSLKQDNNEAMQKRLYGDL